MASKTWRVGGFVGFAVGSVEDPTRTGRATVTVVAASAGGAWDRQFGTGDRDEALAVAVGPAGDGRATAVAIRDDGDAFVTKRTY